MGRYAWLHWYYMTTQMIVESGTYKFIKNQKKNVTNLIFSDYISERIKIVGLIRLYIMLIYL